MFQLSAISSWTTSRSSWLVLFASASALLIAALVFQHIFGHAPCVMCIYQRTAVVGLVLSALLVVIYNHTVTRSIAYLGWLTSAIWGAMLSWEHIEILTAANPFFVSCAPVPNYPSFMPLHEWLPTIFAAPGFCDDKSWQFLGLGMPQWMFGIFLGYSCIAVIILLIRVWDAKRL